jgi:protocatechuate 3,4-dioxygenase beta subunit
MTRVRSILQAPWLVITTAIVMAACGGGSGARVATPAPPGPAGTQAAAPGATAPGPVQVATLPSEPRPIPRGAIGGRVTHALSQDPIGRARVLLSAATEVMPASRVTLSDADGRFRFTDLPAGSFTLTVTKTGFAVASPGAAPPLFEPVPVVLAQDQVREGLDVALTPQVFLSGRLRDTDGTPLANGLVEASRAVFANGARTLIPVADAMTDDLGQFRITGLTPGQYYISARDAAYFGVGDATGLLTYPDTFFPGVVSPDEATRLTLDAVTPHAPIEFSLRFGTPQRVPPPAPANPATAKPVKPGTSSITGRVTALSTGTAIARARVRLMAPDDVLGAARVTLTDANGRYRFDDLPAGQGYVVTANKTAYAARGFGEGPPSRPPTLITLADNVLMETVDIVLAEQVLITGRVLDEDETPFGGALVEAMRPVFSGGRRTMVTVAEAITDERGAFRLTGLPPGQYYLSAFDPAFANVGDGEGPLFYSPTFYPGGLFPDEAVRITLNPFTPSEDLSFRLHIIKPSRITGVITTRPDEAGVPTPLMAANVTMTPKRNDQFSLFTLSEPSMQPNGGFVFPNVAPGRYRIQASGETERQGIMLFQTYTLEVRGVPQSTERMVLSRGADVRGHIEWESSTGRLPVAAAREKLAVRAPMADGNPFGDSLTGVVGTDDTWRIRGLMNGDHFFRVENLPPGWRLKRVEYEGRDITDIPYTFEYEEVKTGFKVVLTDRVSRVFGFLTTPRRDDLQSYAIIVFTPNASHWRPASRFTRITYPDASGYYEITGLPPGQYLIAATRDLDESDLGNPVVFDALRNLANVMNFRLEEGQVGWKVDLSPVVRPRRERPRP